MFVGIPIATHPVSMSWVTMAFASINVLSPIITAPKILQPGPNTQLFPILSTSSPIFSP